MKSLIYWWHTKLNMPKYDLDWHTKDMRDELGELEEADGLISKWSELSDVVYTYTRARWSGHKNMKFPFGKFKFFIGFLYMIPKYSLRWGFFNALGKKFNNDLHITEVRNPEKTEKLGDIAEKYGLDPKKFREEAEMLKRRWVFLK